MLGPERPLLLSRADKERIAYHEGGHAILGLVVPGADPVNRVTIVPRGQALGVTYQRPDSDRYNYPEAYLRARIVGMLGGRAAEEIVYGTKTTGAESDIEQATALARRMVTRWGMSERLGHGAARAAGESVPGRPRAVTPARSRSAKRPPRRSTPRCCKIIGDSHEEAKRLLSAHRKQLDALAEALLARETLNEQEILEVTGLPRAPALPSGKLPLEDGGVRRRRAAHSSTRHMECRGQVEHMQCSFSTRLPNLRPLLQNNGVFEGIFWFLTTRPRVGVPSSPVPSAIPTASADTKGAVCDVYRTLRVNKVGLRVRRELRTRSRCDGHYPNYSRQPEIT